MKLFTCGGKYCSMHASQWHDWVYFFGSDSIGASISCCCQCFEGLRKNFWHMAAFNIWNMNFVGFPNDWQTSKKSYFFGNPRHLLTCEGSHSRYSQFLLRVTTFSLLLNSTFFVGRFTLLTYFANAKRGI